MRGQKTVRTRPWRNDQINQTNIFSGEVRPLKVHLLRKLLQMAQKLLSHFLEALGIGHWLELQESMESRNDSRRAVISPNASASTLVWVIRQQFGPMVWEGFFEEFANDGAFVERLVVILECRNQTAWVELQ